MKLFCKNLSNKKYNKKCFLDKYFYRKRNNHFYFKHTKKYLNKITDIERIRKIIKQMDYWFEPEMILEWKERGKTHLIGKWISYSRLTVIRQWGYEDSVRWLNENKN